MKRYILICNTYQLNNFLISFNEVQSAPNGVQKETPQSEGRIETRPPIKIKIALMDASLKKRDDGGDTKRRKERKKDKKRKHHTHHSHNENRENGCKLEVGH